MNCKYLYPILVKVIVSNIKYRKYKKKKMNKLQQFCIYTEFSADVCLSTLMTSGTTWQRENKIYL